MDETAQQPDAEVARIGVDLPCFTCGYNLRSLPMDGRCPECNSSIEATLRGGWLMFADVQWLKRLRSGVTLILWLVLAAVLSYVGFIITLTVIMTTSGIITNDLAVQVPFMAIGFGITATWIASTVMLTTPIAPLSKADRLRRSALARWAIDLNAMPTLLIIISACWISFITTDFFGAYDPDSVSTLLVCSSYATILGSVVGFVSLMILMRRIARKGSCRGLGRLMSVLIWCTFAMSIGWAAAIIFDVAPGVFTVDTSLMFPVMKYGPVPGGSVILFSTTAPGSTTTVPSVQLTTMPVLAGRPNRYFGDWQFFGFVFVLVYKCAALGWGLCGVAALFWFRTAFSRAIANHVEHPQLIVALPSG